jgi:hypothetical protein
MLHARDPATFWSCLVDIVLANIGLSNRNRIYTDTQRRIEYVRQ